MRKCLFIILIITLAFISCTTEQPKYTPKPYYSFDEEKFNKNFKDWQDLKVNNYSFTWCINGTTPNENIYGTVIRQGEECSVEISYKEEFFQSEHNKKKIPKEGDATFMTSIDDAFNLIKSTYATQKELFDKGELFSVTASVNYDKQCFFPEYASVDTEEEWDYVEEADGVYVAPDGKHSMLSFSITKFEVLE